MPIGNPEPAESLTETSAAKESANTKTSSPAADTASTVPKPVAGDRNAAADLMAAGSRVKSELHKELAAMKTPDAAKEKEMALRVAQNMQRFAPPYVPVGPVVGNDTIAASRNTSASGRMNELNLRADQFQINDQGNLVITNEKLIEFFKGLQRGEGGQDIRLGIMKMKPPGEE